MTLLDRIASRFGYQKQQPKPAIPSRLLQRSFAAGAVNRLTADFTIQNVSVDADLVNQLRTMRARSRQLAKDNDYVRRYVRLIEKNVVGPTGFALTVKSILKNEGAALMIERDFYDWAKPANATVTRNMSLVRLCQLAEVTRAIDGECLLRKVRNFGNDHGFAVQIIPVDCLWEQHNEDLGGGRMIRMGVEKDEWGAPVAYHLLKRSPVDYLPGGERYGQRERVPASEIIHHFNPVFVGQTRGIPDLFSAIIRLNMLGGYEESELVASRVGAGKMGFFTTSDETEWPGDGEDAAGHTITDVSPGTFEQLPAGASVQTFDPQHPNASFAAFLQAMLQGVACAADISYHSLTGDLSQVNYSSARIGLLDERDTYRMLQESHRENVLDPIWAAWREEKLLRTGLKVADIEAMEPLWRPRRWTWVDPEKEINAAKAGVSLGVISRKQVIEESGGDSEIVWQELDDETATLKGMGLIPDPMEISKTTTKSAPTNAQ